MINQIQLQGGLGRWIASGVGLPFKDDDGEARVLHGNAPGPTPSRNKAYATILLIDSKEDGKGWSGEWVDIGTHSVSNILYKNRIDRYSIQFFRQGAIAAAHRFRMWCETAVGQDNFHAIGLDGNVLQYNLSFLGVSEVRVINDVVGGEWEERAVVELTIAMVDTFDKDDQTAWEQTENVRQQVVDSVDEIDVNVGIAVQSGVHTETFTQSS